MSCIAPLHPTLHLRDNIHTLSQGNHMHPPITPGDKSHRVTVAAVRTGQPLWTAPHRGESSPYRNRAYSPENRTAPHTNGVHPSNQLPPALLFPRVLARGRQPGNLPVGGSTVRYRYSKPCRCRCSACGAGRSLRAAPRTYGASPPHRHRRTARRDAAKYTKAK